MSDTVVVGLDIGGTSTRATVLTLTGERLGTGRAGGGNPTSHGAERAADRTADRAARRARRTRPGPGRRRHHRAGRSRPAARRPGRPGRLRPGLARRGPALPVRGPRRRPGRVRLRHRRPRRHGAHRRHRGDRRRRSAACGSTGSPTATAGCSATPARASGSAARPSAGSSPTWTPAAPPGTLATARAHRTARHRRGRPPPTGHRGRHRPGRDPTSPRRAGPARPAGASTPPPHGEPVATALIAEAAAATWPPAWAGSARPERRPPVVLGGGLLTGDTPLAAAVRAGDRPPWPDAPLRTAGDGAAAAAWLAARDLPEVTDPAALHARLFPAP